MTEAGRLLGAKAWVPLVAFAVVLLVRLARAESARLVGWFPWLSTRWGGWTLNLVLAALFAAGIAAYGGLAWKVVALQAFYAALNAAGFHQLVKDAKAPGPAV